MKKNKFLILGLFILMMSISTTTYANHRYMQLAPEYFICEKVFTVIKIMSLVVAVLTILIFIIKKKIQNKIILRISITVLIISITILVIASIIWLINYIKIL